MSYRERLTDLSFVECVEDTHDSDSEYVAHVEHSGDVQRLRAWYLRNARDDLEWVRSSSHNVAYVQFQPRDRT